MDTNTRFILTGDLHIRIETLDLSRRVLSDLKRICKERQATAVILGDLFHTKAIIRSECLNLVLEELSDPTWEVIVLVGNHDYESKDCLDHSLTALTMIDNVRVVNQTYLQNDYSLLLSSFCSDEVFKERVSKSTAKYLFCHQGIAGFNMNNTKRDEGEIKSSLLKKFKHVFSGHYHFAQSSGNVTYVGSPYQMNFGESGQLKRFIDFDCLTGKSEDILLDYPKFHIFKKSSQDILNEKDSIIPVQSSDHIRFDISGPKDECMKISKSLVRSKYNFDGDLRLNFLYENSNTEVTIKDTLDYPKMFEQWLSIQPSQLDRERLLKMGMEYISNANL